jgi:hypothetical protein
MSLGNWGQSLQQGDAEGFGSPYLRDFTHASKTFRTNSYENAPKLKFLFHTFFDINPEAYFSDANYGVLVKEVRLPSFNLATHQMNQYNRKRIIQTKIKYEPIEITFHDDNGNTINKLWEAYYRYYYSDGSKPSNVLRADRGGGNFPLFSGGPLGRSTASYNSRDIYDDTADWTDWGLVGGSNREFIESGVKVPFFKNITIFGFNQHDFTAYTLVNPMITNFSHDTYKYDSGNGIMENRMTIDYETVVYNAGNLDGRTPENIVTGFGSETTYDRNLSPITPPGANGAVLGQGGVVDGAGGSVRSLQYGSTEEMTDSFAASEDEYNGTKFPNLDEDAQLELNQMFGDSFTNIPSNRNTLFDISGASQTPGFSGLAGSPTIGALSSPPTITDDQLAGTQFNGDDTDITGFPVEAPFGVGPLTFT